MLTESVLCCFATMTVSLRHTSRVDIFSRRLMLQATHAFTILTANKASCMGP